MPGRVKGAWALLLVALATCSEATAPEGVARVSVTAPTSRVEVGGTVQLSASAQTESAEVLPEVQFTWVSGDEAVATVDAGGLVTGVAAGSATIRAVAGGVEGSFALTVVSVPVATVTVSPDTATLQEGGTLRLSAALRDSAGADLGERALTWSSDDERVARVSADGTVTALLEGRATITAESEGRKGTAKLTVVAAPLPELTLEEVAAGQPSPGAPTLLTAPAGDGRLFLTTL